MSITIKLTPPRQKKRKLQDYLSSPSTMTELSNKSTASISAEAASHFQLATTCKYNETIEDVLLEQKNHEKLHFIAPFSSVLYSESQDLRKVINDLKGEMERLRHEVAHFKEETRGYQHQLHNKNDILDNAILPAVQKIGTGNLLIDTINTIARNLGDRVKESHSTIELKRYLDNLPDARLQKSAIPSKWGPILRKEWNTIVVDRNLAAHETKAELALFLLYPSSSAILERWRELFYFTYGQTVENVAAEWRDRQEEKEAQGQV